MITKIKKKMNRFKFDLFFFFFAILVDYFLS